MRMHEFFAGLKPVAGVHRVASVSGVANGENTSNIRHSSLSAEQNILCNTQHKNVFFGVAPTNEEIRDFTHEETLETSETPNLTAYWQEAFEERAAIREFEGKFPRHMAEKFAYEDIRRQQQEEFYAQNHLTVH